MSKGIIYITTTSVAGLIKIGKTRIDQFESRMKTLEQNGYWNVNGLKRYFAVEVDDYDEKEKLIHTVFSKSQVSTSELFALDKELAKAMLESFEGKQIFPKINNIINTNNKIQTRSRLTFEMLEIPSGSELTYKDDENIKVKTYDNDNKIIYNNSIYSLSKVVSVIKQNDQAYQGGRFFKYNNEILTDMRDRLEKERSCKTN